MNFALLDGTAIEDTQRTNYLLSNCVTSVHSHFPSLFLSTFQTVLSLFFPLSVHCYSFLFSFELFSYSLRRVRVYEMSFFFSTLNLNSPPSPISIQDIIEGEICYTVRLYYDYNSLTWFYVKGQRAIDGLVDSRVVTFY